MAASDSNYRILVFVFLNKKLMRTASDTNLLVIRTSLMLILIYATWINDAESFPKRNQTF